MNPNENDLTGDEPLPAQQFQPPEDIGSTGREQFRRATQKASTEISHTWDQTKEKASRALDRTEHFMRHLKFHEIQKGLWISWPTPDSGFHTDISEESLRHILDYYGWEGVERINIDDHWNALKFIERS